MDEFRFAVPLELMVSIYADTEAAARQQLQALFSATMDEAEGYDIPALGHCAEGRIYPRPDSSAAAILEDVGSLDTEEYCRDEACNGYCGLPVFEESA